MRRSARNIGMLLVALWLILWGLTVLVPSLAGLNVLLAIIAIAAGVLIILNR